MKIIAICGPGKFIAEVSETEIQKVFDKYYGKMKSPNIGDVIDLGQGYDFRNDVLSACHGMVDASKKFDTSQKTLMALALAMVDKDKQKGE